MEGSAKGVDVYALITTLPSRHPTRPAAAILGHECNICAALAIRRVCSAPRRRGSPSRTNTLRPGGARRDPRCESVGGARVLSLRSWTPPPGPRKGPPESNRAVLTPPSGAFVDPASSRSSVQKYLFTRSSPQVTSVFARGAPGPGPVAVRSRHWHCAFCEGEEREGGARP